VLVGSLGLLFGVEMILPFFVFVPGWPRTIAAAGFIALMIAIQAMGNFGFFNLLVIVLSITLLDPRPVTAQTWTALASPAGGLAVAAAVWSILAGLCHLPFNTYVARGWPEWPAWGAATGAARLILGVLRAAMPFRTAHAYGVFPPRVGAPLKWIPVVEGTRDGERWEPFEYRYQVSTDASRPRFVAPHAPRLDHIVLYEGFGVGAGNYLGSVFSLGNPYDFTAVSTLDRLLERLMERDSPVRDLFGAVPFGGEPPIRMRMRRYMFAPATTEEQRASGRYWRRSPAGEHLAERGPDATLFQRWLPAAEQLHPDDRWTRRRVPRLRPLLQARAVGDVRAMLDPISASLWQPFWEDVLPAAATAARGGWRDVEALARSLEHRYGAPGMDAFDRVRAAVTTALLERIEPHVLGLATPARAVRSYFHASLLAHDVVLSGLERTDDALADASVLIDWPAPDADTRGLMLLMVFRRGVLTLHASTYRLAQRALPASPPPAGVVPGFGLLLPEIAEALPDPGERLPAITHMANGDWAIDGVPILS
jgi:hypothetical protein